MVLRSAAVWHPYNPNPCFKSVGDCAVRAICAALDVDWYEAYDMLCDEGRRSCDLPSADTTWGSVLRSRGFQRYAIPNACPDCYTAADFALEHPEGIYVLAFGGHVATVRNGILWDSWNSTSETPIYFYRR